MGHPPLKKTELAKRNIFASFVCTRTAALYNIYEHEVSNQFRSRDRKMGLRNWH